jgi:PAS domain S-box-containing protein
VSDLTTWRRTVGPGGIPAASRSGATHTRVSDGAGGGGHIRRLPDAVRLAIRVLLVGLACHVSTTIGFAHKLPPHNISVLWPTGAVLLCVLVVTPVRHWLAYTAAAYFSSILNDAQAGFPVAAFLFVGAGVVEVLFAAIGIRYLAGGVRSFDNIRNLVAYLLVAVVLGPALSAFVAAAAGPAQEYWFFWRVWFLSEALARLTLAPAILLGFRIAPVALRELSVRRCLEICIIGCLLIAACTVAFVWPSAGDDTVPALVYLPLPIVLWAAVRFGPPGVSLSLLVVAAVSISGTVHGRGPFAGSVTDDNVVALQLFLFALAVPLMILATLIAEGRRKTNSLTESEARFRAMADSAPVMIWMSDASGRFDYFNKPWLDFSGRTLAHERKTGWADSVHPDDRARCARAFDTAFAARRKFVMEYRRRRQDGGYHWVLDCGIPRVAADGNFVGFIGSCVDIAERKQAEERLRASHEQQRDLARRLFHAQEVERRRLAREMHDDLTQRLAVLAIEVSKLERLPTLADEVSSRLGEVRGQLVTLSEDVHSLSRQLHPAILDDLGLEDALRSECTRFQEREGIEVEYRADDVPTDLPRDACLGLYRIAQESLRNVARHSGANRAEVSLVGCGRDVMLTVSDNGSGFAREDRHRRAGIGLASMEERARLVGAELTIQSTPGHGTTVTVLFTQSEDRA